MRRPCEVATEPAIGSLMSQNEIDTVNHNAVGRVPDIEDTSQDGAPKI